MGFLRASSSFLYFSARFKAVWKSYTIRSRMMSLRSYFGSSGERDTDLEVKPINSACMLSLDLGGSS